MKPRVMTALLLSRDVTVWHGGCGRGSGEVLQERKPKWFLKQTMQEMRILVRGEITAKAQKDEEAFSRGHKSSLVTPGDKTQGIRGREAGKGSRGLVLEGFECQAHKRGLQSCK